jgi:hypothetical protein
MKFDDLNKVRQVAGQLLSWVGLILGIIVLAKFFGVSVPIRGGVQDTALVAIACCLAR